MDHIQISFDNVKGPMYSNSLYKNESITILRVHLEQTTNATIQSPDNMSSVSLQKLSMDEALKKIFTENDNLLKRLAE